MNIRQNRWVIGTLGTALAVTVAFGVASTSFAQDDTTAPGTTPPAMRGERHGPGEWGGPVGKGGPVGMARGTAIADLLGLSEADLRTAIESGQSIADIATAQDVDLQTVIDAIVAEQQRQLEQAVTNGRLTQEEADAKLTQLEENLPTQLSTVFTPGERGPRGGMAGDMGKGFGPFGNFDIIATILGMEESDLAAAVEAGQSVADIAAEQGVDLSTVVDAIIAERTTALQDAVSAGRLTQEQADEHLAMLASNLPEMLSQAGGMGHGLGGPDGQGPRGGKHGERGPRDPQAPQSPLVTPESSSAPVELSSDGSV